MPEIPTQQYTGLGPETGNVAAAVPLTPVEQQLIEEYLAWYELEPGEITQPHLAAMVQFCRYLEVRAARAVS